MTKILPYLPFFKLPLLLLLFRDHLRDGEPTCAFVLVVLQHGCDSLPMSASSCCCCCGRSTHKQNLPTKHYICLLLFLRLCLFRLQQPGRGCPLILIGVDVCFAFYLFGPNGIERQDRCCVCHLPAHQQAGGWQSTWYNSERQQYFSLRKEGRYFYCCVERIELLPLILGEAHLPVQSQPRGLSLAC